MKPESKLREIPYQTVVSAAERLYIEAMTVLQPALGILLECAMEGESNANAASVLEGMVGNFKHAAENGVPICKTVGEVAIFADIGKYVHINGGTLENAVNDGIRRGAVRLNVDGDLQQCTLYTQSVQGDEFTLCVAPGCEKSERMSTMRTFSSESKIEDIEDFIVDTVLKSKENCCFPVVLGVGLGGTIEQSALGAKRALARPVDVRNSDEFYEKAERRITGRINALNIGPEGKGGDFTALAVNIETHLSNSAELSCVVNIGCHATRYARMVL